MMIAIGIDCGTQSTKTIALDAETGEILASAAETYEVIRGLPAGHLEQNPQTWILALENTLQKVISSVGKRKNEIIAIGVSGQQHGLVPLDSQKHVIRPAKLWCDTSTVPQCDKIRKHFGGKSNLIHLIGNDILPGFTAPKILWMKEHEPENWKRLAHILLPHDYLNFYLSGQIRMEYGDASGSALMDVRKRAWSSEICSFIDPDLLSKLPSLQSSHQSHGILRLELAQKWGLSSTVVISAGGGDNMMGAIGTGNIEEGIVTASLGTSGTIYAYNSRPIVDPEGEIAAFCDSTDGWLPLLCTMNVTVATESIARLFEWNHTQATQAIASIPPGSDGVLFLPFLQGERTPNLPHASASFHGLRLSNMTPAHLARAVMEGVTMGMSYGLERLRSLGVETKEIRLTGGGSKNPVWRQICADLWNTPTVTLTTHDGAALGSAIQALSQATQIPLKTLCHRFVQTDETTRTMPQNSGSYQENYQSFLELIKNLKK